MKKIKIFDTTLRDGEQSPGCSMNLHEKIIVAKLLEKLGVDIIEAGFAISSKGDFESVEAISNTIKNCTVASLSRALEKDIDIAYEAVKKAQSPRIHTFIATSDVHMKYKLKMSEDDVLDKTKKMVSYAKKYCSDIEFSCEDATRSNLDFLSKVVNEAIKAGATTINLPDTVGYASCSEITKMFKYVMSHVDYNDNITFSTHCHNDLALAVANSLSAIKEGATQIECTINGIGERAGNTSLEEFVMNLATRKDHYNAYTDINISRIYRTSKTVYDIIGQKPPLNKPIVGKNAFLHESGIHQHGVLSNKETYEIMSPESIGINVDNIILGKHSGRHAFIKKIESLGYSLEDDIIDKAFSEFKNLCDKKKNIDDLDIEAIIRDNLNIKNEKNDKYKLMWYKVDYINKGDNKPINCTVCLNVLGNNIEYTGVGDGPIDAAFNAIENETKDIDFNLEDFYIQSVSKGNNTLGETSVMLKYNEKIYKGKGLSTDIIESSILAFIDALNRF